MPAERWVLLGVPSAEPDKLLQKAIVGAGYRTTRTQSAEDCVALSKRRAFLCAFFSPPFFRSLAKRCEFPKSTYVTLVAEPREMKAALDLQAGGGIHDVLVSPIQELAVASVLARARIFFRQASELDAIKSYQANAIRSDAALLFSGQWAVVAQRWIAQTQNGNNPLLLTGEAGSGKTLLARLVHFSSPRASSPFVTVRCHDRDAKELEREIFGEIPPRSHSAASPRRSVFSFTADGTVLFDRADALPRILQQRLARAIVARRYSPVGGGELLPLEARVIFTVQEGSHRHPLKSLQRDLARLVKKSVLRIPPLRQRSHDFPEITKNVLHKLRRERGVRSEGVTEKSMELLLAHSWPGNVRELEGVLWGASVLAGRNSIAPRALAPFLSNGNGTMKTEEAAFEEMISERLEGWFLRFGTEHLKDLYPMILERVEKPLVRSVLEHLKGNQVRAATVLGINRNTLRRKIQQYGLSRL